MEIDVNIRDIDFFSNKKISNYKVLSKSLGMLCIKIETQKSEHCLNSSLSNGVLNSNP